MNLFGILHLRAHHITVGAITLLGLLSGCTNLQPKMTAAASVDTTWSLLQRPEAKGNQQVEVVFTATEPNAVIRGRLRGSYLATRPVGCSILLSNNIDVPVENGRATFTVPNGGWLYLEREGLIGRRATDYDRWLYEIVGGQEPATIVIPTTPAGTIDARFLDSAGRPLENNIGGILQYSKSPSALPENRMMFCSSPSSVLKPLAPFQTLELGQSYWLTAYHDFHFVTSPEIPLSEGTPSKTVTLRFVHGVPVKGRVLAPNGAPVAGMPVQIIYRYDVIQTIPGPLQTTDDKGRFEFPGINLKVAGSYELHVLSEQRLQPRVIHLDNTTGLPIVVSLIEGKTLSGHATHSVTGKPLVGFRIHATLANYAREPSWLADLKIPSEAVTDINGYFHFSNLPDGIFVLGSDETYLHTVDASHVKSANINIPEQAGADIEIRLHPYSSKR